MIKMYGKKQYTLAGAYKEKKHANDMVKAIREMGISYARLEKCLDYSHNPPHTFYRVWQRKKPESRRK